MKHLILILSCFLFSIISRAQLVSVLTQRYDNHRLGWNSHETKLDSANVNTSQFGLLFARQLDDQVYGQPLVVSNMQINGAKHDVVFVVTVNNSVYAYDANIESYSAPLWHVNLTPAHARVINHTDMTGACGGNYNDFSGNIGIVGSPVIDTFTNAIYMVSRDITDSGIFEQYINALDIYTGHQKQLSPSLITAAYPGIGDGNPNDTVYFDEQKQNQRPALLLYNREIYVSWASHCDWQNYHGWFIGFDDSTLQKTHVFNATPDGYEGGFWNSGEGPCVDDSGYIYSVTGNGSVGNGVDLNSPRGRGESLLKLKPSADTLAVVDFFTPSNYQYLENNDLDYGSDGTIIIPQTSLSISGTKDGFLYVLNTDHLGKYTSGDDSVVQLFYANGQNVFPRSVHGTPIYYSFNNGQTECIYVWAATDTLKQFFFNRQAGHLDTTNMIKGNIRLDQGTPGGILNVSSNGQKPASGVLWASHPIYGDANQSPVPGQLDAYDARDVSKLLWSSQMDPQRDSVGLLSKFNSPVIANGKVYMASFSNRLMVYGLANPPVDTILIFNTILMRDTVHFVDTIHISGNHSSADTTLAADTSVYIYTSQSMDTVHAYDTITTRTTIYITDTIKIVDSIANPLGIASLDEALITGRLYPNPALQQVTVQYTLNKSEPGLSLLLIDMYGSQVMNVPLAGDLGTHAQVIELSGKLSGGTYTTMFVYQNHLSKIGLLVKF